MSFYSESTPIARKQHQCDACTKTIEPGERYTRCSGVVDGGFWHGHYHSDCREIEDTANKDAGWQNGDEWYLLHEIVANEPEVLDDAPPSVRARFGLAAVNSSGVERVA